MGSYGRVLAYILLIYIGGKRFSHHLYVGQMEVFTDLFPVRKLPLELATLRRLFKRIRKLKKVHVMSEGLWGYLTGLIPWKEIKEEWFSLFIDGSNRQFSFGCQCWLVHHSQHCDLKVTSSSLLKVSRIRRIPFYLPALLNRLACIFHGKPSLMLNIRQGLIDRPRDGPDTKI